MQLRYARRPRGRHGELRHYRLICRVMGTRATRISLGSDASIEHAVASGLSAGGRAAHRRRREGNGLVLALPRVADRMARILSVLLLVVSSATAELRQRL